MRESSVRSSDLSLARDLARRLSRQPSSLSPQGAKPAEGQGYASLSTLIREAAPPAPPPVPAPAAAPEAPPAADPALEMDLTTVKGWEQFLSWCLYAARAESGFLVDGQGFVIASHGHLTSEEFDGIGAELSLAMEQLSRIEAVPQQLRSVVLEFGSQWLLGFRGSSESEEFVLGLVAEEPIRSQAKEAILRQFHALLPVLA